MVRKHTIVNPDICICRSFIFALHQDGSVEAKGKINMTDRQKHNWQGVFLIRHGNEHVIGLKADGTVVSFGDNSKGQCNTKNWKDVISISANGDISAAITSSNKLLFTSAIDDLSNRNQIKGIHDRQEVISSCEESVSKPSFDKLSVLKSENSDIRFEVKKMQDEKNSAKKHKQESEMYNYVTFEDHVEIVKYIGTETDVVIPEKINSKKVTVIEKEAFMGCINLKSVKIPNTVNSIGEGAFKNCINLVKINIPSDVSMLKAETFRGCYKLIDIIFQYSPFSRVPSLVSIGAFVFYDCKSLVSIDFPCTVRSLEGNMFAGCNSLKSIIIPNRVTQLHSRFITDCPSLEKVVIPASVKQIHIDAFIVSNKVVIHTELNSYAANFARQHNIKLSEYVELYPESVKPD